MTKGIFISAFGKRGYGFAAWNLAFSLKKFSPDIPITLFCEAQTIGQLDPEKQAYFDDIIFIPEKLLHPFDPCKVKINIYDYLSYDINLVLDADSLALRGIEEIFSDFEATELNYATHIYKSHNISQGRDFPEMWWAYMDDIWEHYKLDSDAQFPATNSSWQLIKQSDESKKLFEQIKKNYENPLPIEKLKNKWGGTQPDELYLNVALAQLGFTEYNKIMFFGTMNDSRANWQQEIKDEYFFLSIFGGKRTTKLIFTEWYDNLMYEYCRALIPPIAHIFKVHYIDADKHMNNPLKLPRSQNFEITPMPILNGNGIKLQPAIIPINKTIAIDSKKLIQTYLGPKGEQVRPTNYFNCSVAEFKGKKYFAYRMERAPWCTRMKIGMCLLDGDLQPINGTHSLLHIDTDKNIFLKDFQCEDPRLFVFNNQLFISYMGVGKEGYAVGIARIDTDGTALTIVIAEDSFYFRKPDKNKPEKNWTFFEHEGKLYCIYWTSPHTIFEITGKEWKEVYKTDFPNNWKHGIIRGGTPPQRHGEYFISFFHSAIDFPSVGRNPQGRQYFMGAYLFEAHAPFTPVAISKEPLLAGEKIDDSIPRMWNKLFVVFPNGKFRKENSWMISFGNNDYECRFAEIPDSLLEENLIWIGKKEMVI